MTNLTPVDEWTTLRAPDEGEQVTAVSDLPTHGPVRPGYQAALNRLQRLHLHIANSRPIHRPWIAWASNTSFKVGPFQRLSFDSGKVYSSAEQTFIVVPGADFWEYVYLREDTGALEIDTTVPDASLIFKTGTTNRRYIGTFRVTGGAIVPINGYEGSYHYAGMIQAATGAPANFAAGLVDLAPYIPPRAKMVRLHLRQVCDSAGTRTIYVRPSGMTPAVSRQFDAPQAPAGLTGTHHWETTIPVGPVDGKIEWMVDGAGAGAGTIYVTGWEE